MKTKKVDMAAFADFPESTKLDPRIARKWLREHGEESRSYPAWHWISKLQKIAAKEII